MMKRRKCMADGGVLEKANERVRQAVGGIAAFLNVGRPATTEIVSGGRTNVPDGRQIVQADDRADMPQERNQRRFADEVDQRKQARSGGYEAGGILLNDSADRLNQQSLVAPGGIASFLSGVQDAIRVPTQPIGPSLAQSAAPVGMSPQSQGARITNTTTGAVPAAVQAAILASDRARILAEENRAVADLYESQAARRHRFPSGAQQAQALRLAQGALDAIAASSRTIAVKDFELSHQTALEAVRMAVSSRASALQAATQYIASVVAQGYSTGATLTGAAHGAEVAKIQAAYQAFAGRTAAAELALKASQADEALTFEAAKANQSAELERISNRLKAFLADAQIIGHEVVSMLNNLRVGSSLTMGVSA